MSSDGSGYVDPKGILEGELIRKEDINATADAWNYVESRVSDINIREEGLSRVNFDADKTWTTQADSSNSVCFKTGLSVVVVPLSGDGWSEITFRGSSGPRPGKGEVQFNWDPQQHTYAIIRASFFFSWDVGMLGDGGRPNSGVDCTLDDQRLNSQVRFGLHIRKSTDTGLPKTKTLFSLADDVYCPVQIGLNPDFAETANGKRGPIKFKYDRRSAMTGTITLLAGGQSWENETAKNLSQSFHALDLREAGTYVATIVCKGRKSSYAKSGLDSYEGERIDAEIGNLNMFVQVLER